MGSVDNNRTFTAAFDRGNRPAPYPLPKTAYNAHQPVSAVVIGAGIAGIATAVLLQAKVPNLTLTVYDRHARVGGTWEENQYPGVRCDVPSHAYQLSFAPNPHWTEFYAKGAEIREYYEATVKKFGVDKHLRLQHEVVRAVWDTDDAHWQITVLDLVSGAESTVAAQFLISATGRLNNAAPPSIPGLDTFQGAVVHTARWDQHSAADILDNKRVAVIGNGASGMQVLPAVLPRVARLRHFARTRNWVSAAFNGGLTARAAQKGNPAGHAIPEATRKHFASRDGQRDYLAYRKELNSTFHAGIAGFYAGSDANAKLRKDLTALISERVNHDPELLAKLIPDYAPMCKRLTPAPGYLEALSDPKVDFVQTPIARVTASSIETTDGQSFAVDTIITATGFPDNYTPAYPLVGRSGTDLRDIWGPGGRVGYPKTYFGVMAPDFPNYFFVLQAQGTPFSGTVPVKCEQTATYIAACIRKVQAQSYAALEPTQDATDDFDAVVEGFFADKATTDTCSSWWKQGPGPSRVTLGWPGTMHHKGDVTRTPRWEDFAFQRRKEAAANRFHYFGSGLTAREEDGDPDELTSYLTTADELDLQTLHEGWTRGY
ncbi:hypothetical protein SPBR_04850 [Sporothrix brasiliensis 5110]|uniref:L-ornithine N(5)-monooxygenase [NAD(P)H] n=1 Tax=Sporothrix brasiliensis 5110 TaxID=1398154 RepID=A0A0C2IPR7_9PEZI|nr:uncharacterized protein SPBR_04850 [Sporothrix brasiliensis 5110]KIH87062.1 hypothetical protein SPBR_04850 [Sporothrix brasiliensis 5110]